MSTVRTFTDMEDSETMNQPPEFPARYSTPRSRFPAGRTISGGSCQWQTDPSVPDARKRNFDPFFTTKANSLGMGLAIRRAIPEAHHGSLWAEPIEEHGAAFHITLTVRQGAEIHG